MSPPPPQVQYARPINTTKSIPSTNEMSTNGSSINKTTVKGPPPPVAPKPSWPRQTSTVTATTIVPSTTTTTTTYSQINNENQINNDIPHANSNVTERHPSQKFNRSSSMTQILTNTTQQQEIIPTRNKSLSIPDSRLIHSFFK